MSILSTIAGSATTSYLLAHHTGPKALTLAAAATHGYTVAFTISAALLGLGAILAILMLPSRRRLEELTSEAAALIDAPPPAVTSAGTKSQAIKDEDDEPGNDDQDRFYIIPHRLFVPAASGHSRCRDVS